MTRRISEDALAVFCTYGHIKNDTSEPTSSHKTRLVEGLGFV
jgi:hypothetical protein